MRSWWFLFLAVTMLSSVGDAQMTSTRSETDVAGDTNPLSSFWRDVPGVLAAGDEMGRPVGRRATEVRSRWTDHNLYFLFTCPFEELHLKPQPVTDRETNELWNWDVAEVFIGSDFENIRRYKEFEISPHGEWVDLDIDLEKPHHEDGWVWNSGFETAARIDRKAKIWYGFMRIPLRAIMDGAPRDGTRFRLNLFRTENARAIAWRAPMTDTFHTPEKFGTLQLSGDDLQSLSRARDVYLDDLLRPHDYAPAKNSYLFQGMRKGERRTVLDVKGEGSVRHIWSTWSLPGAGNAADLAPAGSVNLLVFVDGTLAMHGAIDELCGQALPSREAPFPSFVFKGAYNLYTPIVFSRSVRMEIEAARDLEEFYTQIDYRMGGGRETEQRDGSVPESEIAPGQEVTLQGPGELRELAVRGEVPADARLKIYWDRDAEPAVDAPIDYLFADFVNTGFTSTPGKKACFFHMPFRRSARIMVESKEPLTSFAGIEYAVARGPVREDVPYFHARYTASALTTGYQQFRVLQVEGAGLFVGVNLFDTGHNHGGGDAALLDAGTRHPTVLHGICGEDYFSFAWHQTGTMTPLTGAPVHARRYRLHLENPYPFAESFQFLFGVFAGLQPKAVAFWYQQQPHEPSEWVAVDVPWRALGPLRMDTPDSDVAPVHMVVPIKEATALTESWQDAEMRHGFVDLTYLFRHYIYTSSGTGYVAGASKTRLAATVISPTARSVRAVVGHDDPVTVELNGERVCRLEGGRGFGGSECALPLRAGRNRLEVTVENTENTDWRWTGLSLALERQTAIGVTFASPSF